MVPLTWFWGVCVWPVTPGESCAAWGRNAALQLEEEEEDDDEGERKSSRKKGRTRGSGPYREHSADAR